MAAVVERDEAEWYYDKQDGFLMDVPAEKERGIGAKSGSCDEVGPCWTQEEFDQRRLNDKVSDSDICEAGLEEGLRFEQRESR